MIPKGPDMTCIVCGSTKIAGLAGWHASCPSCDYESAALSIAINAYSGPAVDEAEREAGLKALRLENFRTIVAWARQHAGASRPRLLDVEPDAVVGGRAAARGLPVRSGYFPDVLQDGERFDVIVFNDVIEHIPDIRSALAACHARLDEGGILVLNLPNSRGCFYRLSKLIARLGWRGPFERLWQKDLPSPHVHYFNPRNLQQLVVGQGFTLAEAAELPALRAKGLLEVPSDIIVGVFKKKAAD